MGNRSSRYVKRYEHHLQLQHVQKILNDIQRNFHQFQDDTVQCNKRMITDVKTLAETNEVQQKALLLADQEIQKLCSHLEKLKDIEDLKLHVRKMTNEHMDDRMKLSDKINEIVLQERNKWNDDVYELKQRFESLKKYSLELVSMDLAHEREIKDLQKQISFLQDKTYVAPSQFSFGDVSHESRKYNVVRNNAKGHLSPRESLLQSMSNDMVREARSIGSNDFGLTKVSMAMRKIKEDLSYSDMKKCQSLQA